MFKFNVMKKFIPLLFAVVAVFGLTGCQKNSAEEIIGHTYGMSSSVESYMFYFSPSGIVTYTYSAGGQIDNNSHFTYDIVGDDVEIFFDSSTFWIPEARGTLFVHLTYYPEEDVLRYLSDVLCRLD